MEKVENYLKLNDKYLKEGDALLEKADYVQASEKFWGAVAEVIKAIAAKRGVDFRSHGEMHRFITTLNKETKDSNLLRYFSLAGALHQNFYENWLTPEMVVDYAEAVKSLVEKLKRLARESRGLTASAHKTPYQFPRLTEHNPLVYATRCCWLKLAGLITRRLLARIHPHYQGIMRPDVRSVPSVVL